MLSAVSTLSPRRTVSPKNTTALSRTHIVCIVRIYAMTDLAKVQRQISGTRSRVLKMAVLHEVSEGCFKSRNLLTSVGNVRA